MQRQCVTHTRRIVVLGLFVFGLVISRGHHNFVAAHDARHQAGSVCSGFVILSNGFAVLSGLPAAHGHGSTPVHHAPSTQDKAMVHQKHDQMAHGSAASGAQHLLGYQHGQEITVQQGMLCVPIGGKDATMWAGISHDPTLLVQAESLQGPLTHNSRTNETLALTVMRRGDHAADGQPHVRVLARMPTHDRRMPGGHGPANDPDVQGFVAQLDGQGRYVVQTIDFSMPGTWLFEVHVQQGADTYRAYFAVEVGEE